MSSEENGEQPLFEHPFHLSNYQDGHYEPNGQYLTDPLFPRWVVEDWESVNQRIYRGKLWGAGQALFFKDQPLTFGRNFNTVDVVISDDPSSKGILNADIAISRRHFELQPPKDGKIVFKDLGSTAGATLYHEGKQLKELTRLDPDAQLKVGDQVLMGGDKKPEEGGRLIGFSVCQDKNQKLFLVKFNIRDLEDIATFAGHPVKPEGESNLPPDFEKWPELQRATEAGYQVLIRSLEELEQLQKSPHISNEQFSKGKQFYDDLFATIEGIESKLLFNNPGLAANFLGRYALDQAEKSMRDNNSDQSIRKTKLANLLFRFSIGEFLD